MMLSACENHVIYREPCEPRGPVIVVANSMFESYIRPLLQWMGGYSLEHHFLAYRVLAFTLSRWKGVAHETIYMPSTSSIGANIHWEPTL